MLVRLTLAWCALSVPSSLLVGAVLARCGRPAFGITPQPARVHVS